MAHPEAAVRLLTSDALVDFAAEDVDVAIRAGTGPWPGLAADLLMQVDFTPMVSPEFLRARGGRIAAADLPRLPLISPHDPWWTHWLRESGVDVPEGTVFPVSASIRRRMRAMRRWRGRAWRC